MRVARREKVGKVSIVGAGPGERGLITSKGLRCLKRADIVVYDHLVNEELLKCLPPGVRRVCVGKKAGTKTISQRKINEILVREARKNKKVVRLKGGDPFIFGRGGEEVATLSREHIPFEVVPGISSFIAAPAYAGIPLTYRGLSSSVAIVTGHEDPSKEGKAVDFARVSGSVDTLVCLMGVGNMEEVVAQIKRSGKSSATPVAVIERATHSHQRVVQGTLGDIVRRSREAKVQPPAVMVVGEVVSLRKESSWFESLPLVGKTIVVTRPQKYASSLIDPLEEAGAQVITFPTIEVTAPRSCKVLDKRLEQIGNYNYLVFTSVSGVEMFFSRMREMKRDVRCLHGIKIAAIGEMTARALQARFLYPEIVPAVFTSNHLGSRLVQEDLRGKRILLIRSAIARNNLKTELVSLGARVDEVVGYLVKIPKVEAEQLKRCLIRRQIDLITFTSPSTFDNFATLMKGVPLKELLRGVVVAAIGPVTRDEIRRYGVKVAVVASNHTGEGLVEAIMHYYHTSRR